MLPNCGSAPAKEKNAFKLSSSLRESYTLYKRMTSAVVQWLTKEGGSAISTKAKNNSTASKKKAAKKAKALGSTRNGSKAQTSAKPSVARLRDFASCVAEKAVIVPDGVYYALKEAINVRKAFTARLGKQHAIEG
ncbi:MAG: hypothetical protein M1835_006594, partial [Candelina submexicana]